MVYNFASSDGNYIAARSKGQRSTYRGREHCGGLPHVNDTCKTNRRDRYSLLFTDTINMATCNSNAKSRTLS